MRPPTVIGAVSVTVPEVPAKYATSFDVKAAAAVEPVPSGTEVDVPALNQFAVVVSQSAPSPPAEPSPEVELFVSQKKFAARARGARPTDNEAAATSKVARDNPLRRCRLDDITDAVESGPARPIL